MSINQQNKQTVWEFWQALEAADQAGSSAVASTFLSKDSVWTGFDPLPELRGADAFASGYWQPLIASFPDLARETHIFMGGQSSGRIDGSGDGRMWVGGTGYFNATFAKDYLTIPATGSEVRIRWGEFCRLEDNRIAEIFLMLDLVDLMRQAGCEVLPPSHGIDGLYPPPQAKDGVMLDEQDPAESEYTLEHIRRFLFDGLNKYNQSDLSSMGMADYFHPDVRWYGPGGIGACLSFREFEDNHQRHWLTAFPDRAVQDLDAMIAEGPYSGAPNWAGVLATHTGPYLDCPASGNRLEINGLDFWKLENDRYIENWVIVDMVHLFRQMGVDLFERLRNKKGSEPFRAKGL